MILFGRSDVVRLESKGPQNQIRKISTGRSGAVPSGLRRPDNLTRQAKCDELESGKLDDLI